MFVEKRRSWIATVALGGRALPKIWTRTLFVTALSVGVTVAYLRIQHIHYTFTATPFSGAGVAGSRLRSDCRP